MDKKILSFGMAAVSALSAVTPALAVEQHSGDGNNVPVELTVEKPTFSVTVPTGLPVAVDAAGKVYCSTTATIKNNTFGQVKVSDVTIEGNMPWTVADWATDMQKEKVNTTKIAMQLNNGVTNAAGYQFNPANFPVMNGHASMSLTYDAKLPAQTKVISGDTVANVTFVVGWNTDESAPIPIPTPNQKPNPKGTSLGLMRLKNLAQNKTGTLKFSMEKYNESKHGVGVDVSEVQDKSVMAVVSGEDVTVYGEDGVMAPYGCSGLFGGYKASKIDLNGLSTSNMDSMEMMFQNADATTIEGLQNIDTSHVTNMSGMFAGTKVNSLDLTNFDTSKVTNMENMFMIAKATSIDLSSFDTSKVTNTNMMFTGAKATKVICRTQDDLTKLQSSSNCNATGFQLANP